MEGFVGLPHRLERVTTKDDITFYDDAISTTPESTIAAIRAID
jgi:UDP-N-acetylmuramoylalanine--D-glutamate ligase